MRISTKAAEQITVSVLLDVVSNLRADLAAGEAMFIGVTDTNRKSFTKAFDKYQKRLQKFYDTLESQLNKDA